MRGCCRAWWCRGDGSCPGTMGWILQTLCLLLLISSCPCAVITGVSAASIPNLGESLFTLIIWGMKAGIDAFQCFGLGAFPQFITWFSSAGMLFPQPAPAHVSVKSHHRAALSASQHCINPACGKTGRLRKFFQQGKSAVGIYIGMLQASPRTHSQLGQGLKHPKLSFSLLNVEK